MYFLEKVQKIKHIVYMYNNPMKNTYYLTDFNSRTGVLLYAWKTAPRGENPHTDFLYEFVVDVFRSKEIRTKKKNPEQRGLRPSEQNDNFFLLLRNIIIRFCVVDRRGVVVRDVKRFLDLKNKKKTVEDATCDCAPTRRDDTLASRSTAASDERE